MKVASTGRVVVVLQALRRIDVEVDVAGNSGGKIDMCIAAVYKFLDESFDRFVVVDDLTFHIDVGSVSAVAVDRDYGAADTVEDNRQSFGSYFGETLLS